MEYAVVSTPDDALGLRLDWERFAFAGKFVMPSTGKAVVVADGTLDDPSWPPAPRDASAPGVLAAVSFNRDRNEPRVAWLRFVTVRDDQRGAGIGPRLCAMTARWVLSSSDADVVRIAVNNAYAYVALHKAGFGWTGRTTGIRERVLEHPRPDGWRDRYAEGLRGYLDDHASETEQTFARTRSERPPPDPVDVPKGEDYTGGARRNR